jgi:general secretion pathway protein G
MRRKRSSEAGVTLIEMLVVVVIIGLFVAIVGPKLFGNVDKAKVTAAHDQIDAYGVALGQFKLDTGTFPTSEQGLQALRIQPEGVANWQGPYTKQDITPDPWGHPYIYKFPGDHGDEPDLISYGGDGQPGGDGINADIVSWKAQR